MKEEFRTSEDSNHDCTPNGFKTPEGAAAVGKAIDALDYATGEVLGQLEGFLDNWQSALRELLRNSVYSEIIDDLDRLIEAKKARGKAFKRLYDAVSG